MYIVDKKKEKILNTDKIQQIEVLKRETDGFHLEEAYIVRFDFLKDCYVAYYSSEENAKIEIEDIITAIEENKKIFYLSNI